MQTIEIEPKHDTWKNDIVIIIGIFAAGGLLLIGWGIWDLLSSDAAQSAFATAIRSIGYATAAFLIMAGLAILAYGIGHALRAATPARLAHGAARHGGAFDQSGRVLILPPEFATLPPETQQALLQEARNVRQIQKGQGEDILLPRRELPRWEKTPPTSS